MRLRRRTVLVCLGLLATLAVILGMASPAVAADKPVDPTPVADPANSRLGVAIGDDGRFSIGAFPDASGGAGANSYKLVYGWPTTGTSYSTIRVDGVDAVFGDGNGTFADPPAGGGATDNSSTWTSRDIAVTQRISIVANPLTGQNDAAKIAYTVKNTGATAHSVGTRMMIDTQVNDNDGAPYRVPGIGSVTTERDFNSASAVPDNFSVFQNLADARHIAGAVLRGGDATPPDRLVIGQWGGLRASSWDYTPTFGAEITGDSAYATYWEPATLGAGQSRTYTSYYGLGDVTVDLTPPLSLGLNGPSALTAAGTGYAPNPFTVTATVANDTAAVARDVRLALQLPDGLTARGPTMVPLGDLAGGSGEQLATWTVTAAPATTARTLSYSVSASTTGVAPKTVSRTLTLPAAAAAPARNVVSLGDSYSSGEGADGLNGGAYDKGTNTWSNQCHRSGNAWPRMLGVTAEWHLACSGATVGNLIAGGGNDSSKTTQITRLSTIEKDLARKGQHVDVVTLTIGGNDLGGPNMGFARIIGDCFKNNNCLAGFMLNEDRYLKDLSDSIRTALDQIKSAAPRARIELVGYPRLFPAGTIDRRSCWWLTPVERDRANYLAADLDHTLEGLRDARVEFLSVIGALDGHELCTQDSYVNSVALATTNFNFGFFHLGPKPEQGHPTKKGQKKIADQVRARVNR